MTGENSGGGGFFARSFRNLNRRGRWPLVSVEKDSHAQPPLAAMAVFPLLALPSEERMAFELGGFSYLVPPASWRGFSAGVVEVTAADRAAATFQRRERCELGCLK